MLRIHHPLPTWLSGPLALRPPPAPAALAPNPPSQEYATWIIRTWVLPSHRQDPCLQIRHCPRRWPPRWTLTCPTQIWHPLSSSA
ncbi:hypothetical protein NDU88_005663 [Pleurodeles waltl]|uniref:Secreted protein n=1 Tax=Pleurodeles waltl TaxID=8319 RepID=A0AAV7TB96_PLEWA|nr:hypothetical protein NDU88_005663 [Pleurodeles waltl]